MKSHIKTQGCLSALRGISKHASRNLLNIRAVALSGFQPKQAKKERRGEQSVAKCDQTLYGQSSKLGSVNLKCQGGKMFRKPQPLEAALTRPWKAVRCQECEPRSPSPRGLAVSQTAGDKLCGGGSGNRKQNHRLCGGSYF